MNVTNEAMEQLRGKLAKRVERLHLVACQGEVKTLARVGVACLIDRESLAELIDALRRSNVVYARENRQIANEAQRAGLPPLSPLVENGYRIDPRLIVALETVMNRSRRVTKLVMPFGEFMRIIGAALCVDLSVKMLEVIGDALASTAEQLDTADAPNSAEVLSMIGTDILEAVR